jgi:hypothetical protein
MWPVPRKCGLAIRRYIAGKGGLVCGGSIAGFLRRANLNYWGMAGEFSHANSVPYGS